MLAGAYTQRQWGKRNNNRAPLFETAIHGAGRRGCVLAALIKCITNDRCAECQQRRRATLTDGFLADITREISNYRTRSKQGLIFSASTGGTGMLWGEKTGMGIWHQMKPLGRGEGSSCWLRAFMSVKTKRDVSHRIAQTSSRGWRHYNHTHECGVIDIFLSVWFAFPIPKASLQAFFTPMIY